jgi:hypothetical protein
MVNFCDEQNKEYSYDTVPHSNPYGMNANNYALASGALVLPIT